MSLRFRICDVFTEDRYSGNPLAVVYGADDLSDVAMQRIARQFNLSETIFVQEPDDAANAAKVRIFTPVSEMPFAGHPTIGCAILLAEEAQKDGDFETVITLEERAGCVPVAVVRQETRTIATLTAPSVPSRIEISTTPGRAANALNINTNDIGFGAHRIGVAEAGPRLIFIPVADIAALGRATPNAQAFAELTAECDTTEVYVYSKGTNGADFQARMFAPAIGIPEDPATGAATVCLAAQLDASGVLQNGTNDFVLHQGIEMGRPSRLALGVDRRNGAIEAVRVGGSAVRVMEGTLEPPTA